MIKGEDVVLKLMETFKEYLEDDLRGGVGLDVKNRSVRKNAFERIFETYSKYINTIFKVLKSANKTQIKQVIEKKFGVKVASVNTLNVVTKKRRVGKYSGRTNAYKKAYVKLMEGSKIEF